MHEATVPVPELRLPLFQRGSARVGSTSEVGTFRLDTPGRSLVTHLDAGEYSRTFTDFPRQ
ncbi:hypothetical protein EDF62_1927 [Leucobacter luti]|uniref:Uncharacterized protein n=1 Tax=Leucobacter luti TaxID=340320 RepID=A0A4R6S228_9MICO|nr:hypothetical protein EDF62_1927 [Leucobacter luti]